jgi:hypothetical protein
MDTFRISLLLFAASAMAGAKGDGEISVRSIDVSVLELPAMEGY